MMIINYMRKSRRSSAFIGKNGGRTQRGEAARMLALLGWSALAWIQSIPLSARGPAIATTKLRMSEEAAAVKPATVSAMATGLAENDKFACDPSVYIWQDFQRDGPASAQENLREAARLAGSIVSMGGAAYAAQHGLRSSYFLANAALGTVASDLHERLRGSDGERAGVASVAGFDSKSVGGLGIDAEVASRLLLEAAMVFKQDYEAISRGAYAEPWDMKTLRHRQYNPAFALAQSARFVREAVGTLGRRNRQEEGGIWLGAAPQMYPEYYRNNFHYQTDGWMSSQSAAVYETSTETLFVGRQDAMQRQTLRPLLASKERSPARVLEVACGTGRFATFVRDNLPAAEMTAVDLSPFYLEAARENDDYWRRTRYRSAAERPPPAKFVQAAAEALPFESGAFDAVVCVYLFHEMPSEARAAAAAEFARVCAPGGLVVLTDSMQRGDRPALDGRLGNFAKLNEPHYNDYIDTDLGALFESCGMQAEEKYVASSTKTLSFRKPCLDDAPVQ